MMFAFYGSYRFCDTPFQIPGNIFFWKFLLCIIFFNYEFFVQVDLLIGEIMKFFIIFANGVLKLDGELKNESQKLLFERKYMFWDKDLNCSKIIDVGTYIKNGEDQLTKYFNAMKMVQLKLVKIKSEFLIIESKLNTVQVI